MKARWGYGEPTGEVAGGEQDEGVVVAGLVDVLAEHVLPAGGVPAQPVAPAAEVAAGEVEEVEQQPERGGDGEGRGPAREQRQGQVLQVAGPRQAAQVPGPVAEHGHQLASSSLGSSTVPAQGNLHTRDTTCLNACLEKILLIDS